VKVIFPKQILWLEVGIIFLLGLILVSMILDGVLNQKDKSLPILCPLPLLPPCLFWKTKSLWWIPLYPPGFHMEGFNFMLWETPNLYLLWLGALYITLIMSLPQIWFPYNLLWICLEEGITLPYRTIVYTRNLDVLQSINTNISQEHGIRCRNLISLFLPLLIFHICQN
jgi:hypothetical protein